MWYTLSTNQVCVMRLEGDWRVCVSAAKDQWKRSALHQSHPHHFISRTANEKWLRDIAQSQVCFIVGESCIASYIHI